METSTSGLREQYREENRRTVEHLEPKAVFKWFAEIANIPHGSGNEQAISSFLKAFAESRGLEVYQDTAWNVIIKKTGQHGYERSAPIILQGHMDMVCEKDADSDHDFLLDPIRLVVDGTKMHAHKTTLGGDDGIAVAYILALLDSADIPHPPLEVLITTEEETGMYGAMAVKPGVLKAKTLLNIDSEEEGIFLASCAGGANAAVDFSLQTEALKGSMLKITVSGLFGGHSGMEINKQRANAIKVLARILYAIKAEQAVHLVSISGGSKHNAIAKDAEALICVENKSTAEQCIKTAAAEIKAEYRTADPELAITAGEAAAGASVMYTAALTCNLIDFMMMVPDGVQYMSMDMPGLVQTSLNNGVLTADKDGVHFIISIRSSVKSSLDEILHIVRLCAERTGGTYTKASEYPAWEYTPDSPIRDLAVSVYNECAKQHAGTDAPQTAVVAGVHAGLECGLLKKVLPDMDALSFGPNLYDVHTPKESLCIRSVERVWYFLLALLEKIGSSTLPSA